MGIAPVEEQDYVEDSSFELRQGSKGMPPADVVDWFDRELREVVTSDLLRSDRYSDVEVGDAWSSILLLIFNEPKWGNTWKNRQHAIKWALVMASYRLRSQERDRTRVTTVGGENRGILCMSHLQKEDGPQLDFEFKGVNRGLLERGYLSVAGPDYAWFKKAITRLNQRQATAVRLIVCRQYSITEAADNESISEESMRNILNQAFYRIASSHPAFSPQSINPTDQWVRHACEHMTSRQRDVFDLCFNQALSVGEAAQHLGLHKSSLQGSKMAVVLKLATFYTGTLSVIATATQQSA